MGGWVGRFVRGLAGDTSCLLEWTVALDYDPYGRIVQVRGERMVRGEERGEGGGRERMVRGEESGEDGGRVIEREWGEERRGERRG